MNKSFILGIGIVILLIPLIRATYTMNASDYSITLRIAAGGTSNSNASVLGELGAGNYTYGSNIGEKGVLYVLHENVTNETVITPIANETSPGGGGTDITSPISPLLIVSGAKCNISIVPSNVTLTTSKIYERLTIKNLEDIPLTIRIIRPTIPTLYGLRDIISISNSEFNIYPGQIQYFEVSLLNTKGLTQGTTATIIVSTLVCYEEIPLIIEEIPEIFYDVSIKTNKNIYTPGDAVNTTLIIENMGDIPDSDTSIKFYIMSPSYNKTVFAERKVYEVKVGITEISEEYLIPLDTKDGQYTIGVEYTTEQQGTLVAKKVIYIYSVRKYLLYGVILFFIIFGLIYIKRAVARSSKYTSN